MVVPVEHVVSLSALLFAIGLAGVLLGALIGVPLALNVGDVVAWLEQALGFYVFDPQVYFITRLPSVLRGSDILWTTGLALGLSILATIYPAWRAAMSRPALAMREE